MTTAEKNVGITEAVADPDKCVVSIGHLQAALARIVHLEDEVNGEFGKEVILSIENGHLNIDYFYQSKVTIEEIKIDFVINKDSDEIREKNLKQFDDDYPPFSKRSNVVVTEVTDEMIVDVQPSEPDFPPPLDDTPEYQQHRRRQVGKLFTELSDLVRSTK